MPRLVHGLTRITDAVADALVVVATACGILMSGFVALAAFMRYLVGAPFAFTEELVGLLFAAMVFLALPYCTRRGRHIRVTLIHDRLPDWARRIGDAAARLLVLLFCVAYGWFGYEFAAFSFRLGSATDMGGIVLWPWMAIIPLGCALMAVAVLVRLRAKSGGEDDDGAGSAH